MELTLATNIVLITITAAAFFLRYGLAELGYKLAGWIAVMILAFPSLATAIWINFLTWEPGATALGVGSIAAGHAGEMLAPVAVGMIGLLYRRNRVTAVLIATTAVALGLELYRDGTEPLAGPPELNILSILIAAIIIAVVWYQVEGGADRTRKETARLHHNHQYPAAPEPDGSDFLDNSPESPPVAEGIDLEPLSVGSRSDREVAVRPDTARATAHVDKEFVISLIAFATVGAAVAAIGIMISADTRLQAAMLSSPHQWLIIPALIGAAAGVALGFLVRKRA